MAKKSAGILAYRFKGKALEFFLVHPGGPFFQKKDEGAWSIPKGEFEDEAPLDAAIREFEEETGIKLSGDFLPLTPIKQKSGKLVYAWAIEADIDCSNVKSNTFQMEWPPKSGKMKEFPEVDKCEWFDTKTARTRINIAQFAFIEELASKLKQ
jgi:predicted NUDIX family NTP pyrophosphohydrolase